MAEGTGKGLDREAVLDILRAKGNCPDTLIPPALTEVHGHVMTFHEVVALTVAGFLHPSEVGDEDIIAWVTGGVA